LCYPWQPCSATVCPHSLLESGLKKGFGFRSKGDDGMTDIGKSAALKESRGQPSEYSMGWVPGDPMGDCLEAWPALRVCCLFPQKILFERNRFLWYPEKSWLSLRAPLPQLFHVVVWNLTFEAEFHLVQHLYCTRRKAYG